MALDGVQKRRYGMLLLACSILFLLAFAFLREYLRNYDIATELARMEAENAALEGERLASLTLIEQLSTQTALEDAARHKLNLAASGETTYVFPEQTAPSSSENASSEVALANDPAITNPVKWFYYFFFPDTHK